MSTFDDDLAYLATHTPEVLVLPWRGVVMEYKGDVEFFWDGGYCIPPSTDGPRL